MSAMSNAVPLETPVFSKCSDHVYVDYCTLEWYTSRLNTTMTIVT